jgi:hypothetical protein
MYALAEIIKRKDLAFQCAEIGVWVKSLESTPRRDMYRGIITGRL